MPLIIDWLQSILETLCEEPLQQAQVQSASHFRMHCSPCPNTQFDAPARFFRTSQSYSKLQCVLLLLHASFACTNPALTCCLFHEVRARCECHVLTGLYVPSFPRL